MGRKQDHSAQGAMKGITKLYMLFFFFLPQVGFLFGKEGWSLEWDCPPPFCSCLPLRPFFFKGKWSGYAGRFCFQRDAPHPYFWRAQGLCTSWGRIPRWTCQASVNLAYGEESRSFIYYQAICQHSCKTVFQAVNFHIASLTCWPQSTKTEHSVAIWANRMRAILHL